MNAQSPKPCYIFDIDGTLADCSHRLHHIESPAKNWDAFFADCGGDQPIWHVIQLAVLLKNAGAAIVYVSGRSDDCRPATKQWLQTYALPYGPLYMRQAGDRRDDGIVKTELLAQIRADGYQPMMAFDDRDRVVAAWRAAGVPCAQVAPGAF